MLNQIPLDTEQTVEIAIEPNSRHLVSPEGNLVSIAEGSRIEVWDPMGRRVWSRQFADEMGPFCFSGDGDRLAITHREADGCRLRLVGVPNGSQISDCWLPRLPRMLQLDEEGQRFATVDNSNLVQLWNSNGHNLGTPVQHSQKVTCLAFDRWSNRLLTTSEDGMARIWNIQRKAPLQRPMRHPAPVTYGAFGLDSSLIATASADGVARIWDANTGKQASALFDNAYPPKKGHGPALRKVLFAPDGMTLAALASNGVVRIWPLRPSERTSEEMERIATCYAETPANLESMFDASFNSTKPPLPPLVRAWRKGEAANAASMSQWKAAIEQYDRILYVDDSDVETRLRRAHAFDALRQWDRAARDYDWLIRYSKNQEGVSQAREWCLQLKEMTTLIPSGASWRWFHPLDGKSPNQHEPDFETRFPGMEFDDSSWNSDVDSSGPLGGFGYGDPVRVDIGTPPQGARYSAYFRCEFTCKRQLKTLVLMYQRDDGVIAYLDGEEILRDNVASGDDRFDLPATSNPAYDEQLGVRKLIHYLLEPGKHVLAISLHNKSPWSSDLRLADVTLLGSPNGLKATQSLMESVPR